MGVATTTDVPGVQYVQTLNYKVTDAAAGIAIFSAVAFNTTVGQVKQATTATSGMIAGIAQQAVTATEADTGEWYVEVQVHGVSRYVAGADCSGTIGGFLCIDDAVGRMKPAGSTSQTLYMTHGITLNDPDADGDIGFMWLNLNVPYYPAVT